MQHRLTFALLCLLASAAVVVAADTDRPGAWLGTHALRVAHDLVGVSYSSDGRFLLARGPHDYFDVFTAQTGERLGGMRDERAVLDVLDMPGIGPCWVLKPAAGPAAVVSVAASRVTTRHPALDAEARLVALLPGGTRLAVAIDGPRLRVSPLTGPGAEQIWKLPAFADRLLVAPRAGRLIAICGRQVAVLDAATGKQVAVADLPDLDEAVAAVSPSGDLLALQDDAGRVVVMELPGGRVALDKTLPVLNRPAVAFVGSPPLLAVELDREAVGLLDPRTGGEVHRIRPAPDWMKERPYYVKEKDFVPDILDEETHRGLASACEPWDLAASPDGTSLAVVSGNRTVRVYDATAQRSLGRGGHEDAITRLMLSPDGERLASVSQDGALFLWNARSNQELRRLEGATDALRDVAWSADGQQVAAVGSDDRLLVWNARTGRPVREAAFKEGVYSVAFAQSGDRLATGGADGCCEIRDGRNPRPLAQLRTTGKDVIWHVAFAPGDATLMTASSDGMVRHWSVAKGTSTTSATISRGTINATTSDVKRLAIGTGAGDYAVFDLPTGRQIASGDVNVGRKGIHVHSITALALSPDGRRLAIGSQGGYWYDRVSDRRVTARQHVRILELPGGRELAVLPHSIAEVGALAYAADGRRLFVGDSSGAIAVWEVPAQAR